MGEIRSCEGFLLKTFDGVLRDADLRGADLRTADLRDSNLRYSNLFEVNLRGADLHCADLRGADLRGADLHCANLSRAELRCANLCGANLYGADLHRADLCSADLRRADLRWVDFRGANLRSVRFSDAIMNWGSHDLVSELLEQEAEDDVAKLSFAGLVLLMRKRQWCWNDFLSLEIPEVEWAISVLRKFVAEGDNAPDCLLKKEVYQ